MKILCIGRNYAEHASELGNAVPLEPVVFLKPETALIPSRMPFFVPDFDSEIHHEIELVLRICRLGKNIEERFAHRYYDAITVGLDFTARGLQNELKSKGLPWEKAKAFDGSAAIGRWIPLPTQGSEPLHFALDLDGRVVQQGQSDQMLFGFDRLIAEVSRYFTLKQGDLLFTGTPSGVGPVRKGQQLNGFLNGICLLTLNIR
ncbi:2-hydroxyhepta-2,4-diene-1,7-dioate isomerase [bacterium]|nr:2-hydroxyhepta-2,4-diene-1,7-dioate isomerase [bacterium]